MFVRLGRLFFKSGKFSISAVIQADNEPWGADQPLPAPYSLFAEPGASEGLGLRPCNPAQRFCWLVF